MKSHYRVVVIGGGVVGCSVLYHLAKAGWTDVCLLERKELTAGSSWHAAGGFHALNSDPGIAQLQSYTIALYREIEEISGQDVGMHMTGGLNIAATPDRWEFLKSDFARHRVLGLHTELIGPDDVKRLCPLIDGSDILGAIYDRHEGHVDPSGVTHAYAKAARSFGAEIFRHTRVLELQPTGRGTWRVVTDQGETEAEHVVNAAGLWAREVGAMAGVQLPLIPMEHHYLLTDDIPEVADFPGELPLILDLDAEIYLRQERNGMLVGVYEKEATPWAVSGTPWDYGETELLEPKLDRLSDALMHGYQRFPAVAGAGIRRIVNGPFTFTPDGNPLVGPVPGVPKYWAACGVMAGFAQGGGVGLSLAQWMIEGEPERDIFAMDVARFGPFATENYVAEKAKEFYSNRFTLALPNEYWPAGRPARVDVLYDVLKGQNAVFGVSYGMELPLYFAPAGEDPVEEPTLRRSNAFAATAAEVAACTNNVAIFDACSFAKYEVSGPDAAAFLDRLIASSLPAVGEVRLAPLLSERGTLMGDLTIMRPETNRYLLIGSGYLQNWHGRWFANALNGANAVFRNVSDELQGLAVIGPRSRELLQRLTLAELSPSALPFMQVREIDLGFTRALVARLSLSGELTFEIYAPAASIRPLYERLFEEGRELGICNAGVYAILSMRLEKSHGIWSREFSRDYTPLEAGLLDFIDFSKPAFIGREAATAQRNIRPDRVLRTFAIDATDADAAGYEPIWRNDKYVGFVTSGGYGHRTGKSLAMGYVETMAVDAGDDFEISVLGERRPAKMLADVAYDPSGARARA